ncbi:factor of interpulse interval [Haematobia irritans]|uniref:factor of interpulse interval n=1 Tax=Haematobia irritans TaxID=7368 RepID=UPI003F50868B
MSTRPSKDWDAYKMNLSEYKRELRRDHHISYDDYLVSGNHHENDATANEAGSGSGLTLIPYEPQMVRYINDSFMVVCRSTTTDVKLHWKSPKGEIIKEHKGRLHIETNSKTELKLVFMHLTLEDKGNWTCVDGEGSKPAKMFDLIVFQKITFTENTSVLTVKEGENTTIWCEVTGEPQPNITWYFNGEFIPNEQNATKFRYLGDGLSVINVTQNETGEYTCRAYQVSSIASDMQERTILMKIEHKPTWKNTTMSTEEYAYMNGIAEFKCEAVAEPPANFSWYRGKNKTKIVDSEQYHIEHDNHISILHIKANEEFVFSTYKCKARNHLGSIERSVILKEGEKPPTPLPLTLRGLNSHTFDIELKTPKNASTKVIGCRFEYITELQFKKDAGQWTNAKHKNFNYDSGATFLLNNLEENTTYLVRAATRSIAGLSDWTPVEKFRTKFNQTSGGSSCSLCSSFTHILCFVLVALMLSSDLTLANPIRAIFLGVRQQTTNSIASHGMLGDVGRW